MKQLFIIQPELSELDREILNKQKSLLSKYEIEFDDILRYAELLIDNIYENYFWEPASYIILSEVNYYFNSNINLITKHKLNYELPSDIELFWFDHDTNTLQFKVGEFNDIIKMNIDDYRVDSEFNDIIKMNIDDYRVGSKHDIKYFIVDKNTENDHLLIVEIIEKNNNIIKGYVHNGDSYITIDLNKKIIQYFKYGDFSKKMNECSYDTLIINTK